MKRFPDSAVRLTKRLYHSIYICGFAAAQCGKALPYRLVSKNHWRLRLPVEAQPQKKKRKCRKGGAFPHCAAAEPHWFIEWCLGRVGLRKVKRFPDCALRLTTGCITQSTSAAPPPQSYSHSSAAWAVDFSCNAVSIS
jgi:hypothetical protein